jgi:hypothetical protein
MDISVHKCFIHCNNESTCYDSRKDHNGEQTLKYKKKEASPEECDQAIEGLSTVKAKAKQAQESRRKDETIVRKFWSLLMGIGPALRVVASMSREDWAVCIQAAVWVVDTYLAVARDLITKL